MNQPWVYLCLASFSTFKMEKILATVRVCRSIKVIYCISSAKYTLDNQQRVILLLVFVRLFNFLRYS